MTKKSRPSRVKRSARAVAAAGLELSTGLVPQAWQAALHVATSILKPMLGITPGKLIDERLAQFRQDLREEFEVLLKGRFAEDYVESRSLPQLIILAAQAVPGEPLRTKLRFYARILCRSLTPEWKDRGDRVEEALRALIQVTEGDLRVLMAVMAVLVEKESEKDQAVEEFTVAEVQSRLSDLTGFGIKTYLARLERLGLVLLFPGLSQNKEEGTYSRTHLMRELYQLVADQDVPNA